MKTIISCGTSESFNPRSFVWQSLRQLLRCHLWKSNVKWKDGHILGEKTFSFSSFFLFFSFCTGKFSASSNNDGGKMVKVRPSSEIYGTYPRYLLGGFLRKLLMEILTFLSKTIKQNVFPFPKLTFRTLSYIMAFSSFFLFLKGLSVGPKNFKPHS